MEKNILFCIKCKKQWNATRSKLPIRCPKCGTRGWQFGSKKQEYDFSEIQLGESKIIRWRKFPDGSPDCRKNINIDSALRKYAKRNEKLFSIENSPRGKIITRIK